jgi:hypothetical protein
MPVPKARARLRSFAMGYHAGASLQIQETISIAGDYELKSDVIRMRDRRSSLVGLQCQRRAAFNAPIRSGPHIMGLVVGGQ